MTALPTETELKLWLRHEDAEAFKTLARLRRARPQQRALRTIYFDTADFRLAGKGVALRVRRVGTGWVQTLKTEGERKGGLSTRLELESPVAGPELDFSQLPAKTVAKLIPQTWRSQLIPVYETRFHRSVWPLRVRASRVEVALDVGEIVAGRRRLPLCEVELELGAGEVAALYELAQALAKNVLLIPFDLSKAERGTRLAIGKAAQPQAAIQPTLEKHMPAAAAFACIARVCLEQLQANLPGLLQADDPEYLHQARVAVRRLRSATRLFQKTCPPPAGPMSRIADLGKALGEARDWDVLVLDTLPPLLATLPPAQHRLLGRRALEARRKLRAAALDLVRQPQTGSALLALHRWLDEVEMQPGRPELIDLAGKKLARLQAAVLKASAGFVKQSPAQRHVLRIRVKRLRYALDYLGSLFDGGNKFARHFAALQDALGIMNDTTVALGLVKQLNPDGRLDEALTHASQQLDQQLVQRLLASDKALGKFLRAKPVW